MQQVEPSAHAIVTVRTGKQAHLRRAIAPGERLTVGSSERADVVIVHDKQVLGLHFGLSWDGAQCRMHHLAQDGETLCNGVARLDDDVPHGAVLQAGETLFTLHIEGVARGLLRRQAAGSIKSLSDHPLLAARGAAPSDKHHYAVLDAARDPRILPLLHESVERSESLYEGVAGQPLDEVAPFLVQLPAGSDLLNALLELGWGHAWGIYLCSERPFTQVRRQLRRLLVVQDEADKSLYFRFYDPRVLRVFAPIATPRQRFQFFDGIDCYWYEDEVGGLTALSL